MALQAEMAEELADGARLVVVVNDKLFLRRTADGTLPALALAHGVVVGKRDAIAYSQVSVADALRVFPAILTTSLNAASFAHGVNAIRRKFMFVKQ